MEKYYCKYCGQEYSSIRSLTAASCPRHPDGSCRGNHAPYEGSEKAQYTCKYWGQKYSSIRSLTSASCPRHPAGSCRGKHSPAL